jgi:hypothetical protein
MVRICPNCRWFLGLKAPLLRWHVTHTLCSRCYRHLLAYPRAYTLGS